MTPHSKSDSNVSLTSEEKLDLAIALCGAMSRFKSVIGRPPEVILAEMQGLVELMCLDSVVQNISKRAVRRWYAESQGIASNPHETDSDGDGE